MDQTTLEVVTKTLVLKTSADLGWSDINVSLIAGVPDQDPFVHHAIPDLWLVMSFASTHEATIVSGGTERNVSMPDGWMSVIAPGTPIETYVRNESTTLHTFVRRSIITEVANELFERDLRSLEFTSIFCFDDPGMALLLRSLQQSLFEPAGHADLEAEYLARALAARMLRKNSSLITRAEPAADVPLTNRQVLLVRNYVRDHLSSKIVLKDLASLLNLGQTSLMKRFRASFRQTPHQYVMEQRVSRARELLERSNLPIVEIAVLCGFADQTHLGALFRRIVGVTPSEYRRSAQ